MQVSRGLIHRFQAITERNISSLVTLLFYRKCSDFFGLAQVVFGVAIVLAVMLTARGLYINRDVPDPTGLRRDTFFAAVSGLFIGVPANILQQLDVGGFSMQRPQTFDFVSFYL